MMRVAALALVMLGGLANADEAHDKFTLIGLKIGMPLDGQAGYVCEKDDPKQEAKERHCVKFMDPRCEGKATGIGTLRYGQDAPRGCFLDWSSVATYLDGKLMQTPNMDPNDKRPILKALLHMHLVGTASRPSKIYRLWYYVAPDELTDDSKLFQALSGKFGEPSYRNPPNDMRWRYGDASVKASCTPARYCDVLVEDTRFRSLERTWQEEADAKQRHQNAPDAPKL